MIGITCLAALRSYTLFRLKGCIVKFSFLLTFFAGIVIYQHDLTIAPLLYCSTSNSYHSLVNSITVVFGAVGRVPRVAHAVARMLVFAKQ